MAGDETLRATKPMVLVDGAGVGDKGAGGGAAGGAASCEDEFCAGAGAPTPDDSVRATVWYRMPDPMAAVAAECCDDDDMAVVLRGN